MSNFWNKVTKEYRVSFDDAKIIGTPNEADWVLTNGMTLPSVHPSLWKLEAGKIVKMADAEIAAKPNPMRSRVDVQIAIVQAIPPAELDALFDSIDKHPSFLFALDAAPMVGSYSKAIAILDKAKAKNNLSQSHYDIIKNILK